MKPYSPESVHDDVLWLGCAPALDSIVSGADRNDNEMHLTGEATHDIALAVGQSFRGTPVVGVVLVAR